MFCAYAKKYNLMLGRFILDVFIQCLLDCGSCVNAVTLGRK